MTQKIRLTAANVRGLELPEGKDDHTWWDFDLAGFGYRIQRKRDGSLNKNWVVFYRFGGKQYKPHFKANEFTAEAARNVARNYLAQVRLGINPTAERDKAHEAAKAIALTLADTAQRYLGAKRDVLSLSTYKSTDRHLHVHWAPLTPRPLAEIKRAEVAARLQEIIKQHGRTAAARARSTLSSLFVWSMGEGLCEHNPVIATNDPLANIDNSRDRVLSDRELVAVWNACQDDDFGNIVKLLILTGCRRDEIGSLKWSEIDFDASTITIAAERSKNRKAHCLTLPPMALDILHSIPRRDGRDFVFGQHGGGYSRWGWHTTALRERLGDMPAFTLHDLRRTFRTGLGRLGIPSHVAELAINHVRQGIQAVYDRHTYQREIASALAMWAKHVTALLAGGESGNVTPLRRA